LFPKNRVKLTVHVYVGEVKVLEGLAFIRDRRSSVQGRTRK